MLEILYLLLPIVVYSDLYQHGAVTCINRQLSYTIVFIYLFIMLRQHEHKLLSTRTNTNNNRRKQEHSQTNTDTEDRRQGHHNSLEPITVDPWCMHTNKDLQKYKLELHVNIIRSRNNT